jgi:hypothetical protein
MSAALAMAKAFAYSARQDYIDHWFSCDCCSEGEGHCEEGQRLADEMCTHIIVIASGLGRQTYKERQMYGPKPFIRF